MSRTRALLLTAFAELLAMGLWFGVSAVAPQVARDWHLTASESAWLTIAVQLGFVAGTLLSALLNLPDVIRARHLFGLCAMLGAVTNFLFAFAAHGVVAAVILRFFTGIFLAGVYPPGMKIIATWFRSGRGLALGVLVGALTLGKASPYIVNVLGSHDWRINVAVASAGAVISSIVILRFVTEGPYALPNQPFDISQFTKVFSNRGVRLANFGYFGHMWELYAMWTWAPVMIRASVATSGGTPRFAEEAAFSVIAAGAIGCIAAGWLADRVGRATIAAAAMAMSAACCVAIGFLFGRSPIALLVVAIIWGATVVADSAQFSACVADFADQRYLGTALTLQTCIGFFITTVSISLVPRIADAIGWEWAFVALAPGPVLGIIAMMRLRAMQRAQ